MTEISIDVMSDPHGDAGNVAVMIYMGEFEGPDRWQCGVMYHFNIKHLQEFIGALRSIREYGRVARCIDLDDMVFSVVPDPYNLTIKVTLRGGFWAEAEAVFPLSTVFEITNRLECGLRDCMEGKA